MKTKKDFWDKMGLCLSCHWLEVDGRIRTDPRIYECSCYRNMSLEFFRRQKKCINYIYDES